MFSQCPDGAAVAVYDRGMSGDADWRAVVAAVGREQFIPDWAWVAPMGVGEVYWIDRRADPDQWNAAVAGDTTIATQVDDGATALESPEAALSVPSSSSTAPSLVARFLSLLDPYPGDRVLEVGTGTGWTAALLSARVGAERVTSIEVDAEVAARARENLGRAGFAPAVVVGDGAEGYPPGAPFDRVHVTCAAREVPYAWVAQTRPGGVIVVPWAPNQAAGHCLVLTATGEAATGRLVGEASFMPLRAQRFPLVSPPGETREGVPRTDPRRLAADPGFAVALAGMLPGVSFSAFHARGSFHFIVRSADSHAAVTHPNAQVSQSGPRDLWDETEAAYLTWVGWGCPPRERFGVTVTPEGQRVWLDEPRNIVQEL